MAEVLFWGVSALILATVAGYGAVIIILARLAGKRPATAPPPLSVTMLIAAHNEQDCIGDKLANALAQQVAPHALSIVVVSDGSSDRTAEIVRAWPDPRVSVLEITEHAGKIAALNRALQHIGGDVVIFSDANSHLAPGSLAALLSHFGDPRVGGVCGAPAINRRRSGWLGVAEDIYWRYDNALKRAESRLGGAVSAQGSLYAIRRALIEHVPPSVADDFFISTLVPAAGLRLAFEPLAVTVETVSDNMRGEFGRRVRSTERGWRALLARRGLLNPLRHGLYAVHLLFHKVLRRMVPLLLGALFLLSALLATAHSIYTAALIAQALAYGVALAALRFPALRRAPGISVMFFFFETQLAMAMGLARVALGLHSSRWTPVRAPQAAVPEPGE